MSALHHTLRRERVAGIDLLVRDGVRARAVVLLHGIGGRAASFADVMTRWPAGPALIAWDAPGYGGSTPLTGEWPQAADYMQVLVRVCDEVGAVSIDLVGQSLGALIAARVSLIQPHLVRRLILMSPAHGYRTPKDGTLPTVLSKRLADFAAEGADAFAAARAPRLVHDAATKPAIVTAVHQSMRTLSCLGHTQAVRMLASGDLLSDAAQIAHATLIIAGESDIITPREGTDALFRVLQARPRIGKVSEQLHIVPAAGHAVYMEAADDVARTAALFFEGAE